MMLVVQTAEILIVAISHMMTEEAKAIGAHHKAVAGIMAEVEADHARDVGAQAMGGAQAGIAIRSAATAGSEDLTGAADKAMEKARRP